MSSNDASGATSSIKQSLLPERGIITVSGDDARIFLQGLITNDINKATEENALFGALLSPQGKFLHDFFIIMHDGKLFIDVARSHIPDLIKRLTMYKLRSKVEIAEMPEMQVAAEWSCEGRGVSEGGNPPLQYIKYTDPRLPELGIRVIGTSFAVQDNGEYDKRRLRLGVPDGSKDLGNRSFPMQWAYDKLNAIDFNKGCYVGQEVTARSKHLGEMRKMVHKVQAEGALPPKDTTVMSGEREVGVMASSAGTIGLALLNVEAVSSNEKLVSNGMEIKASLPEWVNR